MRRVHRLGPFIATLLAVCVCLALFEGRAHPLSHLTAHVTSTAADEAVGEGSHHAEDLLCLDCVATAALGDLLVTPARGLTLASPGLPHAGHRWHGTPPRPRERQRARSPPPV